MSNPPIMGLTGDITPNEEALWHMVASLRRDVYRIGGADLLADTPLINSSVQLGEAVVTNAKIANLVVNTIKILGNAVTTGVEFNNTATVTFTTAEVSLGALTFTTQGGPVLVLTRAVMLFGGPATTAYTVELRLKRDGVQIDTDQESNDGTFIGTLSNTRLDSPPVGSHTYEIFGIGTTPGSPTTSASLRIVSAIELKR